MRALCWHGVNDLRVDTVAGRPPATWAPTSATYAGVRRSPCGDAVAWGCRGVGLMAQWSAYLLGAGRVIAIDRFRERLAMPRDHVGSETIDYTQVDGMGGVMGVIMNKGLTLRSAQQHGQAYMPRLLEHASRGELDPSFLATHRFSLEDAPTGYRMFKHKEGGCVRAVFTP